MFETARYLDLMGLHRDSSNVDFLRELHRAHLTEIPYNNVDILLGRPFDLDESALFDKIVVRRLGGFCYELTPLFLRLLRELGFQAEMHSARIVQPDGGLGPSFDHAVIVVHLDQRWLVDVGNSRWFLDPICLDTREWQESACRRFRGDAQGANLAVWEQAADGSESLQYVIEPEPRITSDLEPMCRVKWTSRDSKFVRGLTFGRYIGEERVVVNRHRVLIRRGATTQEQSIRDVSELRSRIVEFFGGKLDGTAFLGELLEPNVLDRLEL